MVAFVRVRQDPVDFAASSVRSATSTLPDAKGFTSMQRHLAGETDEATPAR